MVLEDVIELSAPLLLQTWSQLNIHSDYSGNQTKLPKILLNGNGIAMVRIYRCFNMYHKTTANNLLAGTRWRRTNWRALNIERIVKVSKVKGLIIPWRGMLKLCCPIASRTFVSWHRFVFHFRIHYRGIPEDWRQLSINILLNLSPLRFISME